MFRALLAIGTLAVTIWLLRSGQPFGAVVVIALAIALRRSIESRLLARHSI